jgi:regulator of sirC expression with transglutaminase-like and TPR domain|tara:strand:+ start:283 stop:537 length:255 start_codon:yes stop_codon:yes gene_type:complete
MPRSLDQVADLRENLRFAQATYAEMLKTPTSQYSFQDRQVIYEQRKAFRAEINSIKRQLSLADPTINALGGNQVDFASFRENEN